MKGTAKRNSGRLKGLQTAFSTESEGSRSRGERQRQVTGRRETSGHVGRAGLTPHVIMHGSIGRSQRVPSGTDGAGIVGTPVPPSGHHASREIRLNSAGLDPAAARERRAVASSFGIAWVEGLEALASWARELGIPLSVGSAELMGSDWLRSCGLSAPSVAGLEYRAPVRNWVLRVAPGWADRVADRIESDARLNEAGAPTLVVEESPLAYLPGDLPVPRTWPRREAWRHASQLVLGRLVIGRKHREQIEAIGCPESPEDLMARLEAPAEGRAPRSADQVARLARDLYTAACAWSTATGAFWLAERAAYRWDAGEAASRAHNRNVRVVAPTVVSSAVVATAKAGTVRLGLEEIVALPAKADRALAEAVVTERSRAGAFRDRIEFAQRLTRRGVAWRELARLLWLGALHGLEASKERKSLGQGFWRGLAPHSGDPAPREATGRSSETFVKRGRPRRPWQVPVPTPTS